MSNINDAKFQALGDMGYTGSLDDRERQWLLDMGATSPNISDARAQFLSGAGFPGQYNSAMFAYLGSLGFTGSLNDRLLAYWMGGGTPILDYPELLVTTGPSSTNLAWDMSEVPFLSADINSILPVYNDPQSYVMDYNPATKWLAIGGTGLQVYDCSELPFRLIFEAPATDFGANCARLRFSPDGSVLFAMYSGVGLQWAYSTTTWNRWVVSPDDNVVWADYAGDGRYLVTCWTTGAGARVKVWDLLDITNIVLFGGIPVTESNIFTQIAVHPVHNHILTRFLNRFYVFNFPALTFRAEWVPSIPPEFDVRFSRSGSRLAVLGNGSVSFTNTVALNQASWSALAMEHNGSLGASAQYDGLIFSQDDRFCAMGCGVGSGPEYMRVWDLHQDPIVRMPDFAAPRPPTLGLERPAIIKPELVGGYSGIMVSTHGAGGVPQAWDMSYAPFKEMALVDVLDIYDDTACNAADYNPAQKLLALGGTKMQVYDCSNLPFQRIADISEPDIDFLRISPDGQKLCAIATTLGATRIYNTETWVSSTTPNDNPLLTCDFDGTGNILVGRTPPGGTGRGLIVFDVTDVNNINTIAGPNLAQQFEPVAHPVHNLITASIDGATELIDYDQSLTSIRNWGAGTSVGRRGLRYSNDGQLFSIVDNNGIRIYQSSSADSALWPLLSVSPDGDLTFSGGNVSAPFVSDDNLFCAYGADSTLSNEQVICYQITGSEAKRVPNFSGPSAGGAPQPVVIKMGAEA